MKADKNDINVIEQELNLSTENIMNGLNKRIENDRQKKIKKQRMLRKITAVAAAAIVCVAGIKTVDVIKGRYNGNSVSGYNKTGDNITQSQNALYLSDAFTMKVYAADEDGELIDVENGNKVLIDRLAKTTGYSILNNGTTEVMIKLPIMCEGEDISNIKYEFNNNLSAFVRYYEFPDEIANLLLEHSDDLDKNKENHDKFHEYCYANNLLLRATQDKETGRQYGYQRLDSTYEVEYDNQDTKGFYFVISDYGDVNKRDEDGRINLNKMLQNQILTVTVTKADGSIAQKKYSFEADDDDGKNMPSIKIYELESY